jgi:hypothetical protein
MGGHGSHELNQQEVAKGNGQSEFARAIPTTSFRGVAKNPSPTTPSGGLYSLNYSSFYILN